MEITEYLPVDFRTQMEAETLCGAEEIRLRVGQPLEILYADEKEKEIGLLTEAHMREVLNYLSGYSVYALEEELRQGYFTLEGGHRIGVSGRASYEKHGTSSCMKLLSCISGLNIRLAHEKKGCASVLIPWLYCGENVYHTFFFAPPGVGKTTYLRDCIRLLSKGNHLRAGKKVGVVDERSEIAACYRGIPQNDLGPRTDVLDNCPKEHGIHMLLRSMSPQIIAVDELGLPEDFAAVADCARCGVSILGTIHAGSVLEVLHRLQMGGLDLIRSQMRLIGLQRKPDGRRILTVYEGGGNPLGQGFSEPSRYWQGVPDLCKKGKRGKKPDSGWRGNGYACLCAGDMHWNRNTCGCTIFCLFMKRQMHPCRHFWMRSVYVCATIRIQAGRKSGRIVCRSTKENCRSGRRAGKSLRLPREHFMAKAVQRICDAMKSAENGWKNFWQSHDWNFLKNSGCICLLEC